MSFPFDRDQGLILVTERIDGPIGARYLILALDTGATSTVIDVNRLVALGYDPAASNDRTRITTGSGLEYVARVPVKQIGALGKQRSDFQVFAHTLHRSAGVDGLLGLNFLRAARLSVDFTTGPITFS